MANSNSFQGILIGRFWRKTRASDNAEYFSSSKIQHGGGRYLLLPNPKAGQENESDFNLFIVPVEERPGAAVAPARSFKRPESRPDTPTKTDSSASS